jgi:hypothetical protein
MHIAITFDLELFMGRRQGTVEHCVARPVAELERIAERYGVRFVFFVDTGYLLRLQELAGSHPELDGVRDEVLRILDRLRRGGHDLQLHLHPHWRTARYVGPGWEFRMETFALPRLAEREIDEIVAENVAFLRSIAGSQAVFAHRAGGWSIQPFGRVSGALARHGIWLDSSVIPGAHRTHEWQPFDFRGAPAESRWRFEADPARNDPDGRFVELPIASMRLSPAHYWRHALARKLGGPRHRTYGDGIPTAVSTAESVGKLTRPTVSPVSVDGFKASRLAVELRRHERRAGARDFVVIGHPKALTPFSVDSLEEFVAAQTRSGRHRFVTLSDLREELQVAVGVASPPRV